MVPNLISDLQWAFSPIFPFKAYPPIVYWEGRVKQIIIHSSANQYCSGRMHQRSYFQKWTLFRWRDPGSGVCAWCHNVRKLCVRFFQVAKSVFYITGKWHKTVAESIFQKKVLKHFCSMCFCRTCHSSINMRILFPLLEIYQSLLMYWPMDYITTNADQLLIPGHKSWYDFCLNLLLGKLATQPLCYKETQYHVKVLFPVALATDQNGNNINFKAHKWAKLYKTALQTLRGIKLWKASLHWMKQRLSLFLLSTAQSTYWWTK